MEGADEEGWVRRKTLGAPADVLPVQVAFCTGQSDPGRCALSPAQAAFLATLPVPYEARVPVNFPYDFDTLPYRDVPLALASWHNLRLYFGCRRPAFTARTRPAVEALLARAERTLLLAGSCGLELLARLDLPPTALAGACVFAYGPVGRRAPACPVFRVRGRGDWISRPWCRRPDALVAAGHMDYLADPEVQALCRRLLARMSEESE